MVTPKTSPDPGSSGTMGPPLHKVTSSTDSHTSAPELSTSVSSSDNANLKLPEPGSLLHARGPGDRLSLSSLYSFTSAVAGAVTSTTGSHPRSTASSIAGSVSGGGGGGGSDPLKSPAHTISIPLSPSMVAGTADAVSAPTTAIDSVSVTAGEETLHKVASPPFKEGAAGAGGANVASGEESAATRHLNSWNTAPPARPSVPRRSRSRHVGPGAGTAGSVTSGTVSPSDSDRVKVPLGKVGVCALDVKARSKASRNILTRLSSNGEFEVIIFGDKVILDEAVENWPKCDFLISFFSDGFPLDKAISYVSLRRPFVVNDLPMQKIIWDRRLCLRILDKNGVPTPKRMEVNRDGGPKLESGKLADHLQYYTGVRLEGPEDGTGGGLSKPQDVHLSEDGDSLVVDGKVLEKPFVEKPVSGEDHNVHIYFPHDQNGGGGRRLFRKIGNKSSEWDPDLKVPRAITEPESSYLYEQFLKVDNAEDIKAYTVGPDFCHAETRTSPVVDGLVRRNTHGKEIRYMCVLKPEERNMASKIANAFGQKVCGFDMLRVQNNSYVIDVNGWSFVKDNNDYYDKSAKILREMFLAEKKKRDPKFSLSEPLQTAEKATVEKTEADKAHAPHRKTTIGGHRSEFVKKLMKTPSMSRLRNSSQSSHVPSTASPDTTIALSSPPTFEVEDKVEKFMTNLDPQLPPPALDSVSISSTTHATPYMEEPPPISAPEPALKHSWKLKGMVAVVRHADRTPKQKLKFTFHTQPFVELLRGHQEEVLLKGEAALNSVVEAAKLAMQEGVEDPQKLKLLQTSLARKGAWTGTKVQIKPMFRKRRTEELKKIKTELEMTVGSEKVKAAEEIMQQKREDPPTPDSAKPLSRPPTRSDSTAGATLSRFEAAENEMVLDKLQLIVKWGGEPTHSARYQAQDLGENMRNDMMLLNKQALENVRVFSSSERRVTTSAQIWVGAFLNEKEVDDSRIQIRKDLLDDSNAAKDVMDKVKKKLKLLLREGHQAPPQFAWPPNMPEPSAVVRQVAELMTFLRQVMRENFMRLDGSATASLNALHKNEDGSNALNSENSGTPKPSPPPTAASTIQPRWCCGENPELFKERWEKLFSEFCDSEKVDPSKISELYDTMKFDALHNRPFLEWVFTPPSDPASQDTQPPTSSGSTTASITDTRPGSARPSSSRPSGAHERKNSGGSATDAASSNANLAQRIGLRRRSVLHPHIPHPHLPHASNASVASVPATLPDPPPPAQPAPSQTQESYFKLFGGTGNTRLKHDIRLEKLRELYKSTKVLFDFICPQEYGISDSEKLEIGLLTSLPLLKEIVHDLEDLQASEEAKSFVYFTKESHIYTLLNCILEGGIKTKIERNAIPELDYLSNITFELYESEDTEEDIFTYSIRISVTPGCHTFDPLDLQLDSKHSIGCAPRRSLTAHEPWVDVIETLREKFHTVRLPKSFLAVNVSERYAEERAREEAEGDKDKKVEVENEERGRKVDGEESKPEKEIEHDGGKGE